MKYQRLLGLIVLVLWLFGTQIGAVQAQQPVVYAALFFSPSCGHCHYVISEFLPTLQAEYGEQLQVLYIDVSQPGGSMLFHAACDAFDVPGDRCGYVPTLVIGETVLVGGRDIPDQMPALVRDGIAAGGTGLPPIPGLREAYEAAISAEHANDDAPDDAPEPAPISTTYQQTNWRDRFNQDPLGNGLAVGVLGILLIGFAVQMQQGLRALTKDTQRWEMNRAGWLLILGLAIMSTAIAATIVLEGGELSLPTVLAGVVTLGLLAVIWVIMRVEDRAGQAAYHLPPWLLPVVACLGLVVAGYLAFVEIGGDEAVCGAVGDCNTVQQSEYAEVFGVLPIGLLGVLGYLLMLITWVVSQGSRDGLADAAQVLLLGLALFGTAFSIYLTFLEPFVIGATCAWCLTSAMLMILILCLQAPAGWTATNRLAGKLARRRSPRRQPDW